MKTEELRHKKILILGFDVEGKATLRFLKDAFPDKPASEIGIADQKDGPDYLAKQHDYDIVIKTAGMPYHLVTRPYTTATDIFFANANGTIIGVTGSKGKSTTSSLIYSILKEAGKNVVLAGNIGRPMLDELIPPVASGKADLAEFAVEEASRIYVCELSSYQTGDLHYSPHISVFTSFFPDHMDYHGGLELYWQAKKNLVAHAGASDTVVYNPSYERLAGLAHELAERPARSRPRLVPFMDKLPFPVELVPLLGQHNIENVRGACSVAALFSVSEKMMASAVQKFKALPHRLELVGTFKGITFYDDAISTTPESTIAAIQAVTAPYHATAMMNQPVDLTQPKKIDVIFLGGKDRGYDFSELARVIVEKGIKNVVLFPESGHHILAAIRHAEKKAAIDAKNSKNHIQALETSSMYDAVVFAYSRAQEGSICLLSTASPSYSIWKNFEEKGDKFQLYARIIGKASKTPSSDPYAGESLISPSK